MKAADVMTTPVITVDLDTPVGEIARRLLQRRISAVPVIDTEARLVGVVSEGDLMRRPETGGDRHPSWWLGLLADSETRAGEYVKAHGAFARDVMTREVRTVTEDASLEEIATLLERHHIKRAPVVRGDRLVGIVSRANLLQGIVARQRATLPSTDDRALRDRVMEEIGSSGAQSTYVNALVSGGVVQLWGVTFSEAERDAIELAARHAGGAAVDSHIGVLSPMTRSMLGSV